MTVKYIILHWTGGNYKPCQLDCMSYQLIITGDGLEVTGKPQGETCSTAGMNSITYNISCCGGLTRTPLTKVQCEKLFYVTARKLKDFNLTVDKVFTHYEIGQMVQHGTITRLLPPNKWLKDNFGKIDLTILPYDVRPQYTGEFIRQKIKWYLNKM